MGSIDAVNSFIEKVISIEERLTRIENSTLILLSVDLFVGVVVLFISLTILVQIMINAKHKTGNGERTCTKNNAYGMHIPASEMDDSMEMMPRRKKKMTSTYKR